MKCCKVIATCFTAREFRLTYEFPHHRQLYADNESVLKMVQDAVNNDIDGGIAFDTIIVNNDVNFRKGNEYLKSINDTPSKNGRFIVLTRPNLGGGFGAFNHAFEMTDYDYYLFTEDDMTFPVTEYYWLGLKRFISVKNCGFLALIKVIQHKYGVHAAGGTGISSREILTKLHNKYGMLPNSNKPWDHQEVIVEGEVAFTNKLFQMGYKLSDYEDKSPTKWEEVKLIKPYSQ